MLEFASGVVARLTVNFYVSKTCKQRGIEFHGDDGLLFLGCWQVFDAAVEVAGYDGTYTPVPYVRTPYEGTEWGRGLVELAASIAEGRPQRATGRHAAHVTEVMCARSTSRSAAGAGWRSRPISALRHPWIGRPDRPVSGLERTRA